MIKPLEEKPKLTLLLIILVAVGIALIGMLLLPVNFDSESRLRIYTFLATGIGLKISGKGLRTVFRSTSLSSKLVDDSDYKRIVLISLVTFGTTQAGLQLYTNLDVFSLKILIISAIFAAIFGVSCGKYWHPLDMIIRYSLVALGLYLATYSLLMIYRFVEFQILGQDAHFTIEQSIEIVGHIFLATIFLTTVFFIYDLIKEIRPDQLHINRNPPWIPLDNELDHAYRNSLKELTAKFCEVSSSYNNRNLDTDIEISVTVDGKEDVIFSDTLTDSSGSSKYTYVVSELENGIEADLDRKSPPQYPDNMETHDRIHIQVIERPPEISNPLKFRILNFSQALKRLF